MLYPWISLVVLVSAILFIPKRLTLKENVLVFLSVGYIVWNGHVVVGIMLDLYDFGPSGKVGFLDWLFVNLAPAITALLYLNLKSDKNLLYALTWAILSFLYEWGLVQSGFMKNHGWKTWYSIPVYVMGYLFLPWFLHNVIRKSVGDNQRKSFSYKFDSIKRFRFKEKAR
ncbi:hypothetical protein [Brevibacillus migulae]|uniref:hypothetical protein n=1 Tax=Brevibacillus migulae TaxID=1644114 RepID=UPI00106DEC78|nr:hypothetical protein [Brevibacillus migulae]